jgi:hypothetical protein
MLVFVSAGAGCLKANSSTNTSSGVCYVALMNEAPYSSTMDLYFNGILVSTSGGVAPGEYSSEYGSVKPGNYTVDFKVAGTDSLLYEIPATAYDTSTFYTLILYNTAPKSPAVAAARIVDDYSSVSQTTSAYYRFFNLSPDAPAVDLYLNSSVAQMNRMPMDNLINLSYNAFQPITAGTFAINVNKANTDTVLASLTPSPAELVPGTVYTIFLSGTASNLAVTALAETY